MQNIIYMALLTTAFTVINLLANTFLMGQDIMKPFVTLGNSFSGYEGYVEHGRLLRIQDVVPATMSSSMVSAALIMFLCVLVLPFLQYLFSMGRGYETGILRALGMSKGRAWRWLFLENVILTLAALLATQCIALLCHKKFAFLLLGIDGEMEMEMKIEMVEAFHGMAGVERGFGYHPDSALFSLGLAVAVTLATAGFCNILVSNNTPLKLIRDHR